MAVNIIRKPVPPNMDGPAPKKSEMQTFDSGAKREVKTGKGRFDLIPPCGLRRTAQRYEFGAKLHGDRNWESGIPSSSFMSSAMRHLTNYLEGDRTEDHLGAVVFNVFGLMFNEEKRPDLIDLPKEA